MRDPYDPNAQLENAGCLLLNHGAHLAAVGPFVCVVNRQPKNSNAWYGLGNALLGVAGVKKNLDLLKLSLQCVRRSLQEDPANRFATELAEIIQTQTPLSSDDFASTEAFDGDPNEILRWAEFSSEAIIAALRNMKAWQERCQIVMWLGLQGISDFVPILILAMEKDEHKDVQMAAIKRLAAWPDVPGVRECFERLVASGQAKELGPYPGIALRGMKRQWATELEATLDSPWREKA